MKKFYVSFIALFLAAIILPSVFVFATEDRSFSDNENRMLQTAPELRGDDVLSGVFQEKITSYISDQFPARDKLTALGAEIKKAAGFKDIGDAYLCDDGYYIQKITQSDIDAVQLEKNLGIVKSFAANNTDKNVSMLLIPATGAVLKDKLPKNAESYDAAAIYEQTKTALPEVNIPDLYSLFKEHENDYIYYRTDHHWTTDGALLAYNALLDGKGEYKGELELFSDDFLGTIYSRTLLPNTEPDSVYIAQVGKTEVICDGKDGQMYVLSSANEKDKYKVFFGGNYSRVDITTEAGNGKTLLVIKDSFANSLAPFLTADFEHIIMLDLRYFRESAQSICDNEGVTDILFVNEMSSFSADKNLIKLSF